MPALLRAPHIHPWATCESDEQRLDVFNGLLLAAHWNAAFDTGLVAFNVDGQLLPSPQLPPEALQLLAGAIAPAAIRVALPPQNAPFMQWRTGIMYF